MDSGSVPIGFGLALAMNQSAMEAYSKMTPAQKQAILTRAHQARGKQQMKDVVAAIAAGQT